MVVSKDIQIPTFLDRSQKISSQKLRFTKVPKSTWDNCCARPFKALNNSGAANWLRLRPCKVCVNLGWFFAWANWSDQTVRQFDTLFHYLEASGEATNRSKIPHFVDFYRYVTYSKWGNCCQLCFFYQRAKPLKLLSSNKNMAVFGGQGAAWVTTHWPNQRLSRLQMVTAWAPHRKPWAKPRGSLSKNHRIVVWLLVCIQIF